jgi:hypothetical protein
LLRPLRRDNLFVNQRMPGANQNNLFVSVGCIYANRSYFLLLRAERKGRLLHVTPWART